MKRVGNLAQCCGQIEVTRGTVRMRLDESGGREPCGMHSQNKSCRWSGCRSVQQCFMAKMRVWCAKCGESSFGWMGGGCAVSTIVCDVRTRWVRDAGQSWQRLAGCTWTRVNAHGCMQWHVGGKALARNAWGWLRGCWGVQCLCRWVLDITRSPGKTCGSGGVGTGYDT